MTFNFSFQLSPFTSIPGMFMIFFLNFQILSKECSLFYFGKDVWVIPGSVREGIHQVGLRVHVMPRLKPGLTTSKVSTLPLVHCVFSFFYHLIIILLAQVILEKTVS